MDIDGVLKTIKKLLLTQSKQESSNPATSWATPDHFKNLSPKSKKSLDFIDFNYLHVQKSRKDLFFTFRDGLAYTTSQFATSIDENLANRYLQ